MSPELLCHGDLDERALDALKEFPAEGGLAVLNEFKESNLKHVGNKSAYLCGVMKTYRHKNKLMAGHDLTQKRGPDEAKIKVRLGGRDTDVPEYKMFLPSVKQVASPGLVVSFVAAVVLGRWVVAGGTQVQAWLMCCCCFQEILDRTGYTLDVTTGQRKYGGPPPNSDAGQPGPGHEVHPTSTST